ncbi:MAG: hypothetical protein KQJ78_24020 [Deltaproteobacteria bacterium]|nr:hypothetical protein [Deltaproteobacteria bacterium]
MEPAPLPVLPWRCPHKEGLRFLRETSCRERRIKAARERERVGEEFLLDDLSERCLTCQGPVSVPGAAKEAEMCIACQGPAEAPKLDWETEMSKEIPACPDCGKPQKTTKTGRGMGYCPEHWRARMRAKYEPEESPAKTPEPPSAEAPDAAPGAAAPEPLDDRAAAAVFALAEEVVGEIVGEPEADPAPAPPACPECGRPQRLDKLGRPLGRCPDCYAAHRAAGSWHAKSKAGGQADAALQAAVIIGHQAEECYARAELYVAEGETMRAEVELEVCRRFLVELAAWGYLPGWNA